MNQRIARVNLLVEDYDEAIEFYTKKLDFELIEDTQLNEFKRWVLISPKGADSICIILSKATNKNQKKVIGNQVGGRVFMILFTDNIFRDYQKMLNNKIEFLTSPTKEVYGTVAVFKDLYGNTFDLLEPK